MLPVSSYTKMGTLALRLMFLGIASNNAFKKSFLYAFTSRNNKIVMKKLWE